jgi:hypothetical protein
MQDRKEKIVNNCVPSVPKAAHRAEVLHLHVVRFVASSWSCMVLHPIGVLSCRIVLRSTE